MQSTLTRREAGLPDRLPDHARGLTITLGTVYIWGATSVFVCDLHRRRRHVLHARGGGELRRGARSGRGGRPRRAASAPRRRGPSRPARRGRWRGGPAPAEAARRRAAPGPGTEKQAPGRRPACLTPIASSSACLTPRERRSFCLLLRPDRGDGHASRRVGVASIMPLHVHAGRSGRSSSATPSSAEIYAALGFTDPHGFMICLRPRASSPSWSAGWCSRR